MAELGSPRRARNRRCAAPVTRSAAHDLGPPESGAGWKRFLSRPEDCSLPREPLGGAALDPQKVQAPRGVRSREARVRSRDGLLPPPPPPGNAPAEKASVLWQKLKLWCVQDVTPPA